MSTIFILYAKQGQKYDTVLTWYSRIECTFFCYVSLIVK